MRYKEGQEIPTEQLAAHASDDMLILTAIMGFFIGFILVYLGRKGKQMYLWVCGAGFASIDLVISLRRPLFVW